MLNESFVGGRAPSGINREDSVAFDESGAPKPKQRRQGKTSKYIGE